MSDSESENEGVFACPVCYTGVNTNLISLCHNGHYCCKDCFDTLRTTPSGHLCPMCRDPVDSREIRTEMTTTVSGFSDEMISQIASIRDQRDVILAQTDATRSTKESIESELKSVRSKAKSLSSEVSALARTHVRLLKSSSGHGTRDSVTRSRFEQEMLFPPRKLLPQQSPIKETAKMQKKIERKHAYMKLLQDEIDELEQKFPTFLAKQRHLRNLEKGIETLTNEISGLQFSKRRVKNNVNRLEKSETDLTTSVLLLKHEQDELESRVGNLRTLDDILSKIESSNQKLSRLNQSIDFSRKINGELLDEQSQLDSLLIDLRPRVSSLQKDERTLKASANRWKKKVKVAQDTHKDLEQKNRDLLDTTKGFLSWA